MKRYNHNRSNNRLTSFKMGYLVPTVARHCVAGTTLRGGVSGGFRLASMVHQALSQIRIDTFAISAADRILWEDAEDFYTGGDTGDVRPVPPYIVSPAEGGWPVGSLADHLGFPTGVPNLKCNALPFRLYAYWWNEYVRDEQLQDPLPISTASGPDISTNTELQRMNWPKDMFTTARPEEQLGDDVVIPIASSAPLVGQVPVEYGYSEDPVVLGRGKEDGKTKMSIIGGATRGSTVTFSTNGEYVATESAGSFQSDALTANLTKNGAVADLSNATGILPSDFNFAMARQAWKTKRNLFGSKYRDWLAYLGIKYSDGRLQLPETLGHGKGRIDINGVLQTAPGTDSYVGQMGGTGTGFGSCSYKTYFEEPTTVIHLVCVRPAPTYVNMNPPEWQFEVREDIYTPEFAHVGMAEIKKGILFPTGTDADKTRWGFGNRYDEQRVGFNDISGTFKTTNATYHQGRIFSTTPELNGDFLECNPSPRIFNDMENTDHIEAATIRNMFIERNMVSPNGNPHFR